jgi:dipeptidyl aminopeptidase/acylaminoacyl peptidase
MWIMMRHISLFIFLIWCLPACSAELLLETLLGTPFPSGGVASNTVDKAAWVINKQGRYNVWIAEGPEYKLRQLTQYTEDDGQQIGDLRISNSGESVVYVRGGAPNAAKEIPNPTSDPAGKKRQVWSIPASGGEPILIGEGNHPDISPDSRSVVFVRDGQIYEAAIDGSRKESTLIHARGRNDSPQWSPDGSKILFISYRGDHNFVGLYDVRQKRIDWIAPSVDQDFSPIWSPDGKQIAYLRSPGSKADPPTEFEPSTWFSIWIADAETNQAKEIWKSSDQTGGFAQFYPDQPLMWARDRLLFYWEKDGWMRMYSVPISGGDATALTPAECETETATLSVDRSTLIFSSNCKDIERRHLWTVPVNGGTTKQLTTGKGVETYPLQPAESKQVLFISATATQPASLARTALNDGKIQLLAADWFNDFPSEKLIEPEVVVFRAADGLEIHGQLFQVSTLQEKKKVPAVIYMHGGPIRQMLPAWHYFSYYHNAYAMNQFLAANGYIVLSVNFRCGIGYGRDFRRAEGQGPAGATEYQDILAAAKYLQSHPAVDPQRIGLLGGSYGGYLTAMGLSRDSKLFAAGVDLHGVHDWSLRARLRGPEDWGISGDEKMKLAFESSPVASVRSWSSPVLFIIGDDDRNVDFIETTDLVQRLREHSRAHVETLILPDEVHGFLRYESWLKVYRTAFDFLNRFLKN